MDAGRGQDFFPEVIGLEAVRIGRVAGTAVVALIEGKEPGILVLKLGADADFAVIDCEVNDAAPESEERLARITVALVLRDGVLDGLR